MKPSDFVTELSNDKLTQYKTAAAADASKADKEGDFKKGDKRFSGIVKATKKQFDNDAKKDVAEGDVVPFPKKHPYELLTNCPKCGGSLQGGKDEKGRLKMCIPCMTLYRAPIQQGVAEGQGSIVDKCASLAAKYFNSAGLQQQYDIDEFIKINTGDNVVVDKCASLAAKYFNSAGLQQQYDIGEYIKANVKQGVAEGWSQKYKSSINCSHPKGFSQKAHCAGKKKHNESIEMEMVCEDCGMCETHSDHENLDEACWKGYHKEGNKKMFGKTYPNCVKNTNEEQEQHSESCPHCGGELVSEEFINEKKDACYYKVKSRYKVWPSAYASGALVKCRNKGANNWGNGGKKNESSILEGIEQADESLHDWFNKEKWVRMDTKGNIKGPCAKEPGEGKPKCLPQAKAHSLGKKGRASAAARKRREDPNPERSGKAINVNTKKD